MMMASSHSKGSSKKSSHEKHLGRYVSQVMRAKSLSAREVAETSKGEITAGYVTGIRKGNAANPSVDKIKALARGLGVDRYELFEIACGPADNRAGEHKGSDRLQALELLDLMKKLAVSPWLMAIVEQAAHLRPKELEALLSSVYRFTEARQKAQRKGKRR